MNTVATQNHDDEPTKKETNSARWLIAVDRGARLIADTIASLEDGGDVDAALEDLKTAHALVNGGAR